MAGRNILFVIPILLLAACSLVAFAAADAEGDSSSANISTGDVQEFLEVLKQDGQDPIVTLPSAIMGDEEIVSPVPLPDTAAPVVPAATDAPLEPTPGAATESGISNPTTAPGLGAHSESTDNTSDKSSSSSSSSKSDSKEASSTSSSKAISSKLKDDDSSSSKDSEGSSSRSGVPDGTELKGKTEAIIPVIAGEKNYDPAFEWAAQGEAWSYDMMKRRMDEMRQEPRNMVIYGDSILQCLEFEMGVCQGAKEVGKRRFGKYNPFTLAVGNEKVTSLMHRLLNGTAPVDINEDNVTAVVMMVGNNDIGKAQAQDMTMAREVGANVSKHLTEMIHWLLDLDPSIQVVPLSLIPATGSDFNYKNSQLYIPDQVVNQQLQYLGEISDRIHYVDCVKPFLLPNNTDMSNAELLPDGVHPSAAGFEVLADCLEPTLDKVLSSVVKKNGGKFAMATTVQSAAAPAPEPMPSYGFWSAAEAPAESAAQAPSWSVAGRRRLML